MQPKTKLPTCSAQEQKIRSAVQNVKQIVSEFSRYERAQTADAQDVLNLLQDERVSGDVYTLPRPFSLQSVTQWIDDHQEQARAGEGLLLLTRDEKGRVVSLVDFQFWPEYAACEFGGVIAYEYQSQSLGSQGIVFLCDWVFTHIGARLLAMTTSLDNTRSQKMLNRLGFKHMGEIESERSDGTVRRSLYWELLGQNYSIPNRP